MKFSGVRWRTLTYHVFFSKNTSRKYKKKLIGQNKIRNNPLILGIQYIFLRRQIYFDFEKKKNYN